MRVLVGLLLLTTSAFAAEKDYIVRLPPQQWDIIVAVMKEVSGVPYKVSSPIIEGIEKQLAEQRKAEGPAKP